jgi:hypothetical protein
MRDTWETTVRTAANTMLRYPDKISDGLEAELYALLEKLDTAKAGQPECRFSSCFSYSQQFFVGVAPSEVADLG